MPTPPAFDLTPLTHPLSSAHIPIVSAAPAFLPVLPLAPRPPPRPRTHSRPPTARVATRPRPSATPSRSPSPPLPPLPTFPVLNEQALDDEHATSRRSASLAADPDLGFMAHELTRHGLLSADDEVRLATRVRRAAKLEELRAAKRRKDDEDGSVAKRGKNEDGTVDVEVLNEDDERVVREGLAAREELVRGNMRLVVHIARRVNFARKRGGEVSGATVADLVQEGAWGLIRAAERFDPERGVRFATYAWASVETACRRAAVAPVGSVVKVPLRVRQASARLRAARIDGRQEEDALGGVSMKSVLEAAPHLRNCLLLDAPVSRSGNDNRNVGELIPGADDGPEAFVEQKLVREAVEEAVADVLTPRAAEIVARRFGLGGKVPQTLKEIAEGFGISSTRVSQIVERALKKIRTNAPGLAGLLKFMA